MAVVFTVEDILIKHWATSCLESGDTGEWGRLDPPTPTLDTNSVVHTTRYSRGGVEPYLCRIVDLSLF